MAKKSTPAQEHSKSGASLLSSETILESISDGVFTVDENWRITSFNRAAESITGVRRQDALGALCSEVLRSSLCGENCALQKTLRRGKPSIGKTAYIIDTQGRRVPISLSTAILRDSSGQMVGGAETFRDLSEIQALRQELDVQQRAMGNLVCRSDSMRALQALLPAIAESPATVLLQGETGTGKGVLAKAIHQMSSRAKGPFVAVHCGALPDALLESELFGYKAGAFTGATRDRKGRFALAKGGTLFLDEIGEVSPAMQVRLLRVLQEREYEPLGSEVTEKADVRIIAATHRNLEDCVRRGEFREDLFYRIRVVQMLVPPLRERREDLPMLTDFFLRKFSEQHGKDIQGLQPSALDLLQNHRWPGNVRELENAIESAFVHCPTGSVLLGPEHFALGRTTGDLSSLQELTVPSGDTLQDAQRQLEKQRLQEALLRNGYRRDLAAEELGMHRTTFYRKLKRLGIHI